MAGSEDEKRDKLRAFLSANSFYAACETGHPFWSGQNRPTYREAVKDAKAHDKAVHGGDETATVLQSP
jgi:hypothetical protein